MMYYTQLPKAVIVHHRHQSLSTT